MNYYSLMVTAGILPAAFIHNVSQNFPLIKEYFTRVYRQSINNYFINSNNNYNNLNLKNSAIICNYLPYLIDLI